MMFLDAVDGVPLALHTATDPVVRPRREYDMTPTELIPPTQDGNGEPVHVCILGPSGIGKSPLSKIFNLPGMDPKRVRAPRSKEDRRLCISEQAAIKLFEKEAKGEEWPTHPAEPNWFVFGDHWLFFSAGGDRQCLRFKDAENHLLLRSQMRVEIFAPCLRDILNDDKKSGQVGLRKEKLVALLLNPSATSYKDMKKADEPEPDEDLKQATFYAVTKRTELQRKPVSVPDAQKRVRRLPEELKAWVKIMGLISDPAIEFTSWQHFEFRYHQPDGSLEDARRELLSARDTVLAGLYNRATESPVVRRFLDSGVIRSSAEILELTGIV
jgi:hypothetical protein